jgi:hypothetical protein
MATSYIAEGKLYKIFDEQQVSEKFKKREFVVEIEDSQYPQHIKFQLTQDRCSIIERYTTGDQVKVHFDLSGREFSKNGEYLYFTNLNCWKLEGGGGSAPTGNAPKREDAPFPEEKSAPAVSNKADEAMDDLPF